MSDRPRRYVWESTDPPKVAEPPKPKHGVPSDPTEEQRQKKIEAAFEKKAIEDAFREREPKGWRGVLRAAAPSTRLNEFSWFRAGWAARASDAPPNEEEVERVAKAIFHDDLKDEGGGTWESHDEGEKEPYRSNARAALSAAPSPNVRERELEAWASVGRSGACVHSTFNEDCAGCKLREANRTVRQLEDKLSGILRLAQNREGDWLKEILLRAKATST